MNRFRLLKANEIECRVSTVTKSGCSLLLYKDARCDQNILDETVGEMNWQRHHSRDNANCIVSIWDKEKGQWIEKEDTGTESYTEKEKGLASDSFKRACFNWGIGRELYTAPFIWVTAGNVNIVEKETQNGKVPTTKDRFELTEIAYDENGNITALEIKNVTKKNICYAYGKTSGQIADDKATQEAKEATIDTVRMGIISTMAKETGVSMDMILAKFNLQSIGQMTETQFQECYQMLEKQKEMLQERGKI